MAATASNQVVIEGTVAPGFEPVRAAFAENFSRRDELGAACAVYQHGEVVDLWGGIRDRATGAPWEEDTMVLVYSATKGMAAMTVALAQSRGWLDYDERIAAYWPEFAQAGKERITARQLLAHQAGLFGFDEKVDRAVIADPDRLAGIMARQRPAWEPGERQAYHAISLGFYEGEIIRRVDPRHRTLGRLFADEIAAPLGEDFYIRLPESLPDSRLAPLVQPSPIRAIAALPFAMLRDALNPRSVLFRSLISNPGRRSRSTVSASLPATSRSRQAAASARRGASPGRMASSPATGTSSDSGPRRSRRCERRRSRPGAFGAPGAGGSLGHADPATGIGYAYVTNRMGGFDGDPRDVALRRALPLRAALGQSING